MTSVVVQAASRLLRSVEGYLSFDPTDTTVKFVPASFGSGDGHPAPLAAAMSAQQLLQNIPFALRHPSPSPTGSSTASMKGEEEAEENAAVRNVVLYMAEVLSFHLAEYEAAVLPGGGGAAAQRGAWIVWVSLSVFRQFAAAATTDTPDWPMRVYNRRLQIVTDLYDRRKNTEKSSVLSAGAMVDFMREIDGAFREQDSTDGADILGEETAPFDGFVKEVLCAALSQCPANEDAALEDAEDLFPFHPYSPGFAGRQLAAACLGPAEEEGNASRLASHVREHLEAREAAVQRRGRQSESSPEDAAAAACAYRDAIRHGLGLVRGSIHVVPTSVFAEGEVLGCGCGMDEGTVGGGSLPGAWLVEHTRHRPEVQRQGRRQQRIRLLLPPRLSLLLPGLGVAATEVEVRVSPSPGGDERWRGWGEGEALAPPSTFAVFPPHARDSLVWRGHREESPPSASSPPPLPGATAMVAARQLHPVSALYLFAGDFPCEEDCALGAALLSWLCSAVRATPAGGLVVLVVQSTVSARMLRCLSALGRVSVAVVVVGSVGEWGLSQLALRFDCMPNSVAAATSLTNTVRSAGAPLPPSPLRSVRGGRAGVLIVPLDETTFPRELKRAARATVEFVEVRRRVVVVLGECSPSPKQQLPPAEPMPMRPASESSSSSSSSDCSSADSSSDEDTVKGGAWRSSSRGDASPRPLPLMPYVRCCVLGGGVSPPLQTELLVAFHRVLESLLHRHVLPRRLHRSHPSAPAVELALLSRLDEQLPAPEDAPLNNENTDNKGDVVRFHRRATTAFREAILGYLLACERRRLGGGPVETAWASLQQQQERDEGAGSAIVYRETHLQVRAAYLTVGRCLDELCRTVLLLGVHRGERVSDGADTPSLPCFAPVIR